MRIWRWRGVLSGESSKSAPPVLLLLVPLLLMAQAASMKEMMSIFKHAKAVSEKLNGCTNYCQVGATAGLSTNPHALGDRNKANQKAYFYKHCVAGTGYDSPPAFRKPCIRSR